MNSTGGWQPLAAASQIDALGVHPKVTDNLRVGGSSFQIQAMCAALALEAGLCDVALITYGSDQRSASAGLVSGGGTPVVYEHRYRPMNPPSSYAMAAARQMHEFGTTRKQLAEVAVAARRWAQLNPARVR